MRKLSLKFVNYVDLLRIKGAGEEYADLVQRNVDPRRGWAGAGVSAARLITY